jgi:hypothetical protein
MYCGQCGKLLSIGEFYFCEIWEYEGKQHVSVCCSIKCAIKESLRGMILKDKKCRDGDDVDKYIENVMGKEFHYFIYKGEEYILRDNVVFKKTNNRIDLKGRVIDNTITGLKAYKQETF